MLVATWSRPPLPMAMSQAEIFSPAVCEPLTTGMAEENVSAIGRFRVFWAILRVARK